MITYTDGLGIVLSHNFMYRRELLVVLLLSLLLNAVCVDCFVVFFKILVKLYRARVK